MRYLIRFLLLFLLTVYPCLSHGTVCVGFGTATCTPAYDAETLTGANATDDAGGNEADATTGWTNSGCVTFDSIDTSPQSGTYHITAVADSSSDEFKRTISGTAGNLYKVSMYLRHNGTASANGEWRCYLSQGASNEMHISPILTKANTTYAKYEKIFYLGARQDTIQCGERNAANDGGIYLDNVSVVPVTTMCLNSELFTDGNGASLGSEANSAGSFSFTGSGGLTVETDAPADGTYYLEQTSSADGDRFTMDLSGVLSVGTEYFIKFKGKAISGDGFSCGLSGSSSAGSIDSSEIAFFSAAESTWTQIGYSFTYATATHRYFICKEGGTNNNAVFGLDSISIKEILSK
jgi:hypothetical protein